MTTNCLFVTYSLIAWVYPTLILNCIRLPINALRFFQMKRRIQQVNRAANGDLPMEWLKPITIGKHFDAGTVMFRKGDATTELYFLNFRPSPRGRAECRTRPRQRHRRTRPARAGQEPHGDGRMHCGRRDAGDLLRPRHKALYPEPDLRIVLSAIIDGAAIPDHPGPRRRKCRRAPPMRNWAQPRRSD